MDCLQITGGTPLFGTVAVSGSKNAALPIMAASILATEPVCLSAIPELTDVETLALLLRQLGVEVEKDTKGCIRLETVDRWPTRADYTLVRRMRASFCVLGPLLASRGCGVVSLPGGCNIGTRPVDIHLAGLSALGADIRIQHGYVIATARRLKGAEICLHGPRGSTVTGTANVLSAATLARGRTVLRGAAIEPEIVDLGRFLIALGARIDGLGTDTIEVQGVSELGGAEYTVIPDRIEAATLLLAVAASGGAATVTGLQPDHLPDVIAALVQVGCAVATHQNSIDVRATGRPRSVEIVARPYPGIPTDVQAQFTALLCLAAGDSTVRDAVFPERFMHLAELQRLGAHFEWQGDRALIRGVESLSGAHVAACDLRASAALVIAAIAARGQTVVHDIHHLDRGYHRLEQKLRGLGAMITRDVDIERSQQPNASSSIDFTLPHLQESAHHRRQA